MIALPLAASMILVLLCLGIMAAGAARLFVVLRGVAHMRREGSRAAAFDRNILLTSDLVPDVSILAVAPDASENSIRFVRQLVKLYFGRFEVVLVLDGASPEERAIWSREFHLRKATRPESGGLKTGAVRGLYLSAEPIPLLVVDKEAGGEADGLNAGLNFVDSPAVATVDWDAEFTEDALLRLIEPMIDDPQNTVAVGATAPPSAGRGLAGRIYRLECLRNWLGRCAGFSSWNAFLPAPGSFLLFRRDAVAEAGGFRSSRGGCALEMMLHLHGLALARKQPYTIRLISGAIARPTPVTTFADLRRRMARDQMEVARALRIRGRMAFAAAKVGDVAIPGLYCSRLILPLLEMAFAALAAVAAAEGWIDLPDVALLAAAMAGFGILVSMTMVLLEPAAPGMELAPAQLAGLFFCTIWENLGYRQFRNVRLIGSFFRGLRA